MHLRYDIRVPTAIRRAFTLAAFSLALCLPAGKAAAINQEGLVAMASVQGMLIAIANVNRAMRDAAENPMDKWRREAVQTAIRAMPAAILALAADFQAGNLHDKDFPMVQAMMGGFVDVNAADAYKKFLKAPSADLIPSVGSNFPQQYIRQGPSGPSGGAAGGPHVTYDDNAAKRPSGSSPFDLPEQPSASKAAALKGINEKQDKALDSLRVTFDDNVKKGGDPSGAYATDDTVSRMEAAMGLSKGGAPVGTGAVGGSASPTSGDPSAAYGVGSATLIRRGPTAVEDSLDEDFFDKTQPGKGKPDKAVGDRPRAEYQLKVKPKYWQMSPYVRLIESLILKEAHAECKGDCGGGDGQGGGGQGAAQILMGIAAIISAIAPMVIASTQAEAEKAVAATNAMAQIEMTNITANTSKFLSNQQTAVALQQTAAAERINKLNQDGVSERLNMQLAELRSAREDADKRERDRLAEEKRLNEQRIALAQKQADDNLKLARESLNDQLTQAGLTSGFGNSRNSGNALTSTPIAGAALASTTGAGGGTTSTRTPGTALVGSGASGGTTSTPQGLGALLGDSGSSRGGGYGGGYAQPGGAQGSGGPSNNGGGAGITVGQLAGLSSSSTRGASSGRDRLVSSLGGSQASAGDTGGHSSSLSARMLSGFGLKPPGATASGTSNGHALVGAKPGNSAADSRALAAMMNSNHRAVRGSRVNDKLVITGSAAVASNTGNQKSDLTNFTQAVDGGFAQYEGQRLNVVQEGGGQTEESVAHSVRSQTQGLHNPPVGGHGGGASN